MLVETNIYTMKYTTKTQTILAALCSASVLLLSSCNDSSSSNNNTSEDGTEDTDTAEPAVPSIPASLENTSFVNPNYDSTASMSASTFSFETLEIKSSTASINRSGSTSEVESGTFSFSGRGRTSSNSSTTNYSYANIPYTYNPTTGKFVSEGYYIGGYAEGTIYITLQFDLAFEGKVPVTGTIDTKNLWLSDSQMIVESTSWDYSKND